MTAYDPANIFAKIIRGEMPCHKVFEDEHTLAFMDVMPQADGHVLVVPKAQARNLLDVDAETLAALMATVQRIARAAMRGFDAGGVLIKQYNEVAAGQTVFHLHVHVVPRHEGIELKPHGGRMADPALLARHAERIRAALSSFPGTGEEKKSYFTLCFDRGPRLALPGRARRSSGLGRAFSSSRLR